MARQSTRTPPMRPPGGSDGRRPRRASRSALEGAGLGQGDDTSRPSERVGGGFGRRRRPCAEADRTIRRPPANSEPPGSILASAGVPTGRSACGWHGGRRRVRRRSRRGGVGTLAVEERRRPGAPGGPVARARNRSLLPVAARPLPRVLILLEQANGLRPRPVAWLVVAGTRPAVEPAREPARRRVGRTAPPAPTLSAPTASRASRSRRSRPRASGSRLRTR